MKNIQKGVVIANYMMDKDRVEAMKKGAKGLTNAGIDAASGNYVGAVVKASKVGIGAAKELKKSAPGLINDLKKID